MHSSFTWKHWIGLMLTSAAYFLPYKQLVSMAKPVYSDNGELLDGGFDLSTGGICEYLYDVIYITVFVQLMSIISEKFWWTYLVVRQHTPYDFLTTVRPSNLFRAMGEKYPFGPISLGPWVKSTLFWPQFHRASLFCEEFASRFS